ncbi:MAG: hypothetical protein WBM68_00750 [Woeseia sp.]
MRAADFFAGALAARLALTFFADGFATGLAGAFFLLAFFDAAFFFEAAFFFTAGFFFDTAVFFAAAFLVVFPFFFETDFFLDAAFFRDGAFFFEAAFFLLTFFFDAVFFLLAFFFVTVFFLALDFFAADFLAAVFFFVTLAFFPDGFLRAADFFDATLLRVAATFLRFLVACFFAGIVHSCRSNKIAELYMPDQNMEARISLGNPAFRGQRPQRPNAACGRPERRQNAQENTAFRPARAQNKPACLNAATIVLSGHLHYTSPISRQPWRNTSQCD